MSCSHEPFGTGPWTPETGLPMSCRLCQKELEFPILVKGELAKLKEAIQSKVGHTCVVLGPCDGCR
jgi:hypothetical protein